MARAEVREERQIEKRGKAYVLVDPALASKAHARRRYVVCRRVMWSDEAVSPAREGGDCFTIDYDTVITE